MLPSETYLTRYRPGLLRACSEVLTRLRTEAHLSQEDLASAAHLDLIIIREIEAKRRVPGLGALMQLAAALEVPPEEMAVEILEEAKS